MNNNCKKCLLLEAGEKTTYEDIMRFLSSLDESEKADENTAQQRLNHCKNCEFLISGMCLKCGCYVEIRTRLKKSECPNYDNKKW